MNWDFITQNWFWTGLFTLSGSLLGILGNIIREQCAAKSKARIERIKLYESNVLKAYIYLYDLVVSAYDQSGNAYDDLSFFINSAEFKRVKINRLYYSPEIRGLINKLSNLHKVIDDFTPEEVAKIYGNDFRNIVERLEKLAEERTEQIFNKWN